MELAIPGHTPRVDSSVWIAPDAWVIGDVILQKNVSVFFGAVIRGDIQPIRIGESSNIQEHCVLHTSRGRVPCEVGAFCTIGHRAILHGCTVSDRCLIGMGSIILDETVIGEDCLIGAGTLIPEGKRIPPRSLVFGNPGKVIRELREEELQGIRSSAESYVAAGLRYKALLGGAARG